MLKFFKASNAPIILIIYGSQKKTLWQQIIWNTETNVFTEGQWIKCILDVSASSISPCGNFFYYSYSKDFKGEFKTCIVVSKIPYFTALLFNDSMIGRYYQRPLVWDVEKRLPIIPCDKSFKFTLKNSWENIFDETCFLNARKSENYEGLYSNKVEGYTININKIIKDGNLIYDASKNKFNLKKYPY